MAKQSDHRPAIADIAWRAASLVCLVSAYELADTGFVDLRWLAVTVISALVVATAPSVWSAAETTRPPQLGWSTERVETARRDPQYGPWLYLVFVDEPRAVPATR